MYCYVDCRFEKNHSFILQSDWLQDAGYDKLGQKLTFIFLSCFVHPASYPIISLSTFRKAALYNMKKDVQHVCKICDICATRNRPIKQYQEPMQKYVVGSPMERIVVGPPMERIAVDIQVRYWRPRRKIVIVQTSRIFFTKWAEAVTLADQEAATVATMRIDR